MTTNVVTTTRNNDLAQQYDDVTDDITSLLRLIAADLKRHNHEFAATNGRNWGFHGDLTHVRELLKETHNFLNNIDEE